MAERPTSLGPVQLVIVAFDGERFDGRILDQLGRLRKGGAVRLVDLLFVAKDEDEEVVELVMGELSAAQAERYGALVRALLGVGGAATTAAVERVAADTASRSGSRLDPRDTWYLVDQIPTGAAAAVVLLEHLWAVPLRDAIEAAAGHDLVDTWIHPEDLAAIGATKD